MKDNLIKLFLIAFIICRAEAHFCLLRASEQPGYEQISKMSSEALYKLCEDYKGKKQLDSALGYYILLAGRYQTKLPPTEKYLCAKACKEAGTSYYMKNNYTKALDFLMQGVKYCEENDFRDLLPGIYNNIGCVYSSLNDFKISVSYFEKGLSTSRELNDSINEKILLKNLACHCSNDNIKDKAALYNRQLMEQYGKEDSTITFYVYLNKGWLLYNDSCYAQAASYLNQALAYAHKNKLPPNHDAVVYETLGAIYMQQPDKRDSAYYYLKINCNYAEKYGLIPNLRNTLRSLADCCEQDGRKEEARAYKIRYWELSDTLLEMNHFQTAKNNHFLYEMELNYEKIKRLHAEKQEKEDQIHRFRSQLISVLTGLFIVLILAAVNIIQKKKLHRAYKDLFNRNATILHSEKEYKERLIELREQLEEEKSRNERLISENNQKEQIDAEENQKTDGVKVGYSNGISDSQRRNIQSKLDEIMESTCEIFDCNFSIDRLSELIGTNSHYLSQVINETYNRNFRTFINEYRIKEAQRRLLNTEEYGNYTIKAIAESVGYKSHTSFITLFKKATGITPSVYQQLAIEQSNL